MPAPIQQRSLPGWDRRDEPSESNDLPPPATTDSPGQRERPDHPDEACDRQPVPVDIKGWNVYAVDAHSLIFQVFHALPEMSSPRGEQVGAVFGFVRDMLYLIEEKKPDALICAFDLSGPTFRSGLYDQYKAERGEMPEELVGQIPKIEQALAALGIPVLTSEGFEADDVLATIARICDERGANCYIVTGDKDCRQLITDRVAVYNIRKNHVFDAAALRADWGVGPDQVVDFQALVGDKVDNVPGVAGIGPKTAQQLLETYGTLDNLLEHAAEVPGSKGKKLLESREVALLSRQLVRLDNQVPIEPDWDASRVGGFDGRRLTELFGEFGFRTFAEKASRLATDSAAVVPTPGQTADYDNYHLINTPRPWKRSSINFPSNSSSVSIRKRRTCRRVVRRSSVIRSRSNRARRITCPSAARPATPSSTPMRRSNRCGPSSKIRRFASWGRTSSTT
jgi:DNA polymerase I